MSERLLEDFREDEAVLDMAADQRMRQRIAELTRNQPDAEGEWPFRTEPVPLHRSGRDTFERETATRVPAGAGIAHRSRRLMAVAAAVMVVALVGGAVVLQRAGSGPATDFGGESIESMAALARQQPDRPLGPGQYLHQTWEALTAGDVGTITSAPVTIDRWTAIDGTGREISKPAQGSEQLSHLDFDVLYEQKGLPFFADYTYQQLRGLPTDSSALLGVVAEKTGVPMDNADLLANPLAELLMVDVTPAGVRAAAFEALDDLGARPLGIRTDGAGRAGLAFEVDGGSGVTSIIVDPATSALLEWRAWPEGVESSLESATSWRTMLMQEIVSSTD